MAEGSEAEANCAKDDSAPGGIKKDGAMKNDESNISMDKSDDDKNRKSEGETNKGESSGLTPKGAKSRQRIYRPKRPPSTSSSSSSDDERTVCDSNEEKPLKSSEKKTNSGTNDVRKNATIITSAPSEEETSADTSRDTETDHVELEPASPSSMETGSGASAATSNEVTDDSPASEPRLERQYSRHRIYGLLSDSDSDSDNEGRRRSNRDSVEDENNQRRTEEAIAEEMKRIKELPKPKHHWNFVDQVVQRQFGGRARYQSSILFSHHYYDSLHVPKRLELMYKMEFHRGCVNALSFNSCGSRLASGSDDFHIAIWDWAREKAVTTFNSHHRNNVFQSKFLPLSGDSHIVSCARDGQVRLAELSSSGEYKSTRKLAKHNGPAHKLATLPTSPHVVLSAGEDAVVLSIDIRQEQPDKLAVVKDVAGSKVSLYSIHAHPVNEHQYCVSGHDQYVRVYDRRLGSYAVLKLCPRHLYEASPTPTVTCAVYSSNGDAVLASYNDDDIYLFDTSRTDAADAVHKYSGHRNNATVKGVNFFGPGSQYVVSGSDCGNIFIWHRETEAIVQCMPGDENGVVNVLEPHPHIPVLATSGLDDDVKIWVPTSEYDPELPELDQIVKSNLRRRHKERNDDFTGLDRQMLMVLWNHIRRNDRRRRRGTSAPFDLSNGADGNDGTVGGSSSDESNDSDGSEGQHGIQCATH
ncbi:DDB1- and CUL4-associated factor 8-like isoform X3 [Palaemon carinicauda]